MTDPEDLYASSFASKVSMQSKVSGARANNQRDTLDMEMEKYSVSGGIVSPDHSNSNSNVTNPYLKMSQAS